MAVMTIGALTAQQPIVPPPQRPIPEPNSRGKSRQYQIAVRGCLENGRLRIPAASTAELPFDTLNASEFILEGPKEMLRQIQEYHHRHHDEIQGIATVPPPPDDSDATVETAGKGRVRIAAGRRDDKSPVAKGAPRPIRLRVASLTHLNEGCVAR